MGTGAELTGAATLAAPGSASKSEPAVASLFIGRTRKHVGPSSCTKHSLLSAASCSRLDTRVGGNARNGCARAIPRRLFVVPCVQMATPEPLSRWAAKKEQKRQMYAQSTEGTVVAPIRRGQQAAPDASKACQKCLQHGHWTYECKNSRVYIARTSKSAQVCFL